MATKKTAEGGRQASGAAPGAGAQAGGSGRKTASAQKSAPAAKGTAPSKSTGAAKSAPGGGATAAKSAPAKGAAPKRAPAKRAGGGNLQADIRSFAAGKPQGWDHDEWLGFLEDLRSRGHNIEDREAIGSMLERERLGIALEKVPGIGAQRVRSIAERYGNIWRLKETSADDLARDASIPRPLAERIVESVR